ncbi:hypothetical protein EKG40_16575 [Pseudomonas moorei]|jgi:hypothetical protein|nr:hypothetical protein EKG40_16575 [Pseudomonas moorei]
MLLIQVTKPVGASLLAKAECQQTLMLTVPPSSRAGSLPQGFYTLNDITPPRFSLRFPACGLPGLLLQTCETMHLQKIRDAVL